MTDLAGLKVALLKWHGERDLEAPILIVLNGVEAGTLHMALASYQQLIEDTGASDDALMIIGSIRHSVEKALVQCGYGGDPRP